eukprot:CAMPEP_0181528496 /NCGR_PEP_ID=MMETSP1110-20121109/70568_1 /TAXON_ID=174948 /ORGANISM="Symbiodinium sp., Strain CCMP421" /LENGTH=815 /DNA_ID=CAMNT_0023659443 /DNA_START=9 /DNA_END=2453 /DNA_ORIENTATION=-
MTSAWMDNIILLSDSYKVSHWRQYPPGTQYVYSYFESRGSDRDGWDEVCFFGLQYFLKRYLAGVVVTREKIDQAAKVYAQHFGDGVSDNPDLFFREGWEYILEKHGGRLPVKIKALPEGTVMPNKTVLVTVINTDPECFWLTNFLETLLVQVWYPMTVCTNSRYQKLSIQKGLEETGCEDWAPPGGTAFKLHDFGFRGVSSVESAALGGLGHLVNFMGSDTVIALAAAQEFYSAKRAIGFSIPASEHSTITSWGVEGELDAMQNMLEQYPTGLVACVSDSFDVFKACREYWGDALKDKIKGRISETSFGQLVVRPDSGDPEETCVAIMKILLEQFAEDVTVTKTGHKLLPPYIRVIQGDGVDYQSIPKILNRFKDEGIAAANITFGSGGALLQKVNRDTFKVAFKCAEIILEGGESREVFKDPLTDDGKASKKGRLTLQLASDIPSYAPEDVYQPRQGPDGVKGGTGHLHFSPDGKYVTVASGKGDPEKDLLVDVFENGEVLKEYKFGEIRKRADIPNGPWENSPDEPEEEEPAKVEKAAAPALNGVKPQPQLAPAMPYAAMPRPAAPFVMPTMRSASIPSQPMVMQPSPVGAARVTPVNRPSFVAAPQAPQVPQVNRPPSFVAAPMPQAGMTQPGMPQPGMTQPGMTQPQAQSMYVPSQIRPAVPAQMQIAHPSFVAAPGYRPSFVAAPMQQAPMYASTSGLQATMRPGMMMMTSPGSMGPTSMPQRSASLGVGFGMGNTVQEWAEMADWAMPLGVSASFVKLGSACSGWRACKLFCQPFAPPPLGTCPHRWSSGRLWDVCCEQKSVPLESALL